jgi:hypothetical protein
VLFGDLDTNMHVNNLMMGRFFEESRVDRIIRRACRTSSTSSGCTGSLHDVAAPFLPVRQETRERRGPCRWAIHFHPPRSLLCAAACLGGTHAMPRMPGCAAGPLRERRGWGSPRRSLARSWRSIPAGEDATDGDVGDEQRSEPR